LLELELDVVHVECLVTGVCAEDPLLS
jgi:hypothetical protein